MLFRIDRISLWPLVPGVLLAGLAEAPLLVLAAFATLTGLLQLARKNIPPPLVIGLLVLWLMASLQLLYFDVYEGFALDPLHETATLYSLVGVLALALGARTVSGLLPAFFRQQVAALDANLQRIRMDRLFGLYLVAWLLNAGPIVSLPLHIPAIGQFLLPLFTIKWAFFFLICVIGLRWPTQHRYLLYAVAVEVIGGVGGFWGGFIQFVYFFGAAFLYARPQYPPRYYIGGSLLISLIGLMAVHWTAIKDEYRSYISGGTHAQVVTVDYSQRIFKFFDLMLNVDAHERSGAMEGFVRRVGYIDPFADVLNYIPQFRPHGDGEILRQSVEHVLMPRFLFPDKPVLDDSAMTRRYTGKDVAGTESNTSINIGYFGEAYADWGFPGMVVFLFALGMVFRVLPDLIARRAPNRLLGEAVAVGGLLAIFCAPHSTPKMFGFLITTTVMLPLTLPFISRWLVRYLMPAPRIPRVHGWRASPASNTDP